jgi:hypothetical protein
MGRHTELLKAAKDNNYAKMLELFTNKSAGKGALAQTHTHTDTLATHNIFARCPFLFDSADGVLLMAFCITSALPMACPPAVWLRLRRSARMGRHARTQRRTHLTTHTYAVCA